MKNEDRTGTTIESETTNKQEIKASQFGKDFIWGTATASYQIEGAWNTDGKGESIWDHFTHHTRRVKNRDTGDVACDFYHRYESDIELMHRMNIPASRFSISWPRLLPDGTGTVNTKGVDFYNRVIDRCLKENIEPWVTCYHWDLPQKLQEKGGWASRDILGWFEEYVALCARQFGDRVKNWMVFNEPVSFVHGGYLAGVGAPGKIGFRHFYPAVHYTTLCQGVGGRVLKEMVQDGHIGTTYSCMPIYPLTDSPGNMDTVKRYDALLNRIFIEPTLGMGYPVEALPALKKLEKYFKPEDENNIRHDFDFIGLQNYTRLVIKPLFFIPVVRGIPVKPGKFGNDVTQMNWEVYPEGIYAIIRQFAQYKQIKKFYITENGAAFNDEVVNGHVNDTKRIQYLKEYMAQVLRAKNEGINIGGYFVWSFMDNFEWAEGYRPRFGLVHVDYNTQKRTIKDSGNWFSEFLKS